MGWPAPTRAYKYNVAGFLALWSRSLERVGRAALYPLGSSSGFPGPSAIDVGAYRVPPTPLGVRTLFDGGVGRNFDYSL